MFFGSFALLVSVAGAISMSESSSCVVSGWGSSLGLIGVSWVFGDAGRDVGRDRLASLRICRGSVSIGVVVRDGGLLVLRRSGDCTVVSSSSL